MKILFIDPTVNSPTSNKYKYYDGVFDQIKGANQVYHCKNISKDINELYNRIDFEPDCVIFGLGWFGNRNFGKIENLNLPTVCFLFKPQNDLKEKLEFCKINKIDVIATPVPCFEDYEQITNIKTELFPYGFNPEVFKPRKIEKEFDIGFSGALHQGTFYPKDSFQVPNLRVKIRDLLASMGDMKVFWNSSDDPRTAFIDDYEEYAVTINRSKIWIATQAAYGDITPRFYEILGSGTLLFCQKIPETYKFLLKDGYNCVEFSNDLSDFEKKLRFYLEHPRETQRIIQNAVDFFHENWTWNHRAKALTDLVEGIEK